MLKKDLEKLIVDFILKHKESYYRLAYSYVKNADDALDIVQESIYKAISSKHKLKNPESIRTWFFSIVVNTSLDFLGKHKRLEVVDEEALASYDPGIVDNYENLDLKRALDDLPDNYRTVIILRYFEDLKIEEVAEILNENVNTIKTQLYTALKKLRIKLDDWNGDARHE